MPHRIRLSWVLAGAKIQELEHGREVRSVVVTERTFLERLVKIERQEGTLFDACDAARQRTLCENVALDLLNEREPLALTASARVP